jgi:probable rRNA maturation factor
MIDVTLHGRAPAGVDLPMIRRALHETFRLVRKTERGTVSVAFITDAEMKKLNQRWRKKNRTTDVLSFAPAEIPGSQREAPSWGDIFVAPVTVKKEADRRGIHPVEECLRVTVHGLLHLFGYDHATEEEEFQMFSLQERVIERVLPSRV